jgi:hypothetical protein
MGGISAPDTAVLTGQGDISGDITSIRRNGVLGAFASNDLGSGNYTNQPLYIGRNGAGVNPFNGYLYSLIVRGAPTPSYQITATEAWINSKIGAY